MQNPLQIDYEQNKVIRAEIGERLRIILGLQKPQKLSRHVRLLLDRLAEQDQQIEMAASPSILPSQNEGWLRRLLAGRLR
jgi:hypothetical protein